MLFVSFPLHATYLPMMNRKEKRKSGRSPITYHLRSQWALRDREHAANRTRQSSFPTLLCRWHAGRDAPYRILSKAQSMKAISFWGSLLTIAMPLADCGLTTWAWPGAWSTVAVFYPMWVSIFLSTWVSSPIFSVFGGSWLEIWILLILIYPLPWLAPY